MQIPGAIAPLVTILLRLAAGGALYIQKIVQTPRLIPILLSFLNTNQPSDLSDLIGEAKWKAAPALLRLMAALCRAGKPISLLLLSQGKEVSLLWIS